jgi:glucuronoarabinoxylan endo-1,4-beta-xylanase
VAIRVYDPQGRVVSDVFDAVVPAGTHEASFDPSSLRAGVYFYRLLAGRYVETRKLTLLK